MPTDFALIGQVDCGKTALMNALLESHDEVRKTQSAVFHGHNVIDTPGEFTGCHAYYGALLSTVLEVNTIVYLQPANSTIFSMPAGLLQVYPNKRVIGVISKVDLPDADVKRARRILHDNRVPEPYFETSTVTGTGVAELRAYLADLQKGPLGTAPPKYRFKAA